MVTATSTVGGNWTNGAVWTCTPALSPCVPNISRANVFNVDTDNGHPGSVLDSSSSPTTITVNSWINNWRADSYIKSGTLTLQGSLTNDGFLDVYPGASLTVGASGSYTQTQTSDYFARNTYLFGTLASPGGANIDDGELFGDGTVNESVINSSRVFPSGKLTINGDYTQGAGGTLEIDRSDRTRTAALDVTGNAMLDGTLSFVLPLGYVPWRTQALRSLLTWEAACQAISRTSSLGCSIVRPARLIRRR